MKRDFIAGSEWLFYKVYCGYKTADSLIGSVVGPLSEKFLSDRTIDEWFFIRYADPNPHFRWRLHFTDLSQIGEVISTVYSVLNPLIQSKQIHKVMLDSYKREIERYGESTMELCERFFCLDSKMICSMQREIQSLEDPELYRWLFALGAIDSLLDCFNYELKAKHSLLLNLAESFGKEFNKTPQLERQLSEKYRTNRKRIYEFIKRKDGNSSVLYSLLDERYEAWKVYSNSFLSAMPAQGKVSFDSLMSSLIHMCLNRIFVSQQRKHELVEYSFLERYYRSEEAKIKYGKTDNVPDIN